MRSSWRSWFWNIVLMLSMLLMAGIATAVEVDVARRPREWPAALVFGAAAAVLCVAAIRSLVLGVFARQDAVVVRGFTRTTTIPWVEIAEIAGSPTSGAAGSLGAETVALIRVRPGREPETVTLDALGGYGVIRRRSLADIARSDLHEHLRRWRSSNIAREAGEKESCRPVDSSLVTLRTADSK